MGLTAFKLIVGFMSGSVGVISEGIHSFLDLISAAVSFVTVREAVKPADHDHPFGHGKIETLSSLFESILLILAAAMIVYEAVDHVRTPQPVAHQSLAILAIFVSMAVSYLIYRHNAHAGRVAESSALQVNALHFLSDVVASAGVLVGLVLLKLTGWLIIDPLIAFAVAAYILVISAKQVKRALQELSDTQLPEREIQEIRRILDSFRHKAIDTHDLRTRKSGMTRHIDFHLVVCGVLSVLESHAVCDEMESRINDVFPGSSVNIHVEPCEQATTRCHEVCKNFREVKARGGR